MADRQDGMPGSDEGPKDGKPAPAGSGPDAHASAGPPARVDGRFELLQEIGSGSSGTVYRARLTAPFEELETGSEVAVKFLRPELAGDPGARRRLFAEGEVGQSLRHGNVAQIYGVETVDLLGVETTYLLMQFVPGTTLRDMLHRSGPPVEDLVRRLGSHAARGLFALHRRGLVHRDIKPENLILTPDSELKIVDLGLARPFGPKASGGDFGSGSPSAGSGSSGFGSSGSGSSGSDSSWLGERSQGASPSGERRGSGAGLPGSGRAGSGRSSGPGLAGSVAYTAPEILRGQPAGPKSDLYALGVVLYEVATGKHPFADAATADDMLHAHLYRLPPLPSHLRPRISPLLEQLLLDLLQKKPEDRPRSANELGKQLELGERSDWWRRHEAKAPALASSRRLLRMRRPAEAAFVNRREETSRLDAALQSTSNGKGTAIAVIAPESTGRRRLLDHVMQRWLDRSEPPYYLGGEADSGLGHGEPFASALLDVLLRGDERDTPNARDRATAAAKQWFALRDPDADALVAVAFGDSTEPSEVRANRLADAFLRLSQAGSAGTRQTSAPVSTPLVVRIDRAEDLDTSGTLILQRLAAAASSQQLLVLLTAGPDTQLPNEVERLELQGLDQRSFRQFGRELFRAPITPRVESFLEDAWQILSGLPGSLLESLDHLVSQGELRGRVGDYHALAAPAEVRPAPRHVARFRERVHALDPAHRQVLSAAAVLGDRCQLSDLAALILEPELSVLETLSLFRGRIVRAQGGEVSFRHRDFRTELLRSLPADDKQRLHAAAASLLEARGEGPLAVGMHRSMALDHRGCIEPLLRALENRVQAGSRRTALRLIGRLDVHLRHLDENTSADGSSADGTTADDTSRQRLRFLVLSGNAQQAAGQHAQANQTFREAERLARGGSTGGRGSGGGRDLPLSAAARIGLANGDLNAGRMLSAIALLEVLHNDFAEDRRDFVQDRRAEPAAKPADGEWTRLEQTSEQRTVLDTLATQAHALHGRILLYLGQAADCMKHLQAAKKRVPASDDDLRCHLWIDLARADALAHRYATALRTLAEIERADPVLHRPRARLRFHLYRGQLRSLSGDPHAGQDLRRAQLEAEELSLPVYGARASLFLGERALWRGREDEANDLLLRAIDLAQAGGDRLGEAIARAHRIRLGGPDVLDFVQELDLPQLRGVWLLARSHVGRPLPDAHAQLEGLLKNADLPLPLHLRALLELERPASARSLVRAVSERFAQRGMQKRFRSHWGQLLKS
ncbi:MAG: protein kinase [Planctomycetota bacterium]